MNSEFTANCDGVLSIWDSEDNAIATDVAVAANTVVKPATTTLNVGKNSFRYVFTPDAGYIQKRIWLCHHMSQLKAHLL